VHNYSIFSRPRDRRSVRIREIDSEERWEAIARTDVCRRWWKYMRDLMPSKPDDEPLSRPLHEVFHL
jgi:L-rhamnose mutarotase